MAYVHVTSSKRGLAYVHVRVEEVWPICISSSERGVAYMHVSKRGVVYVHVSSSDGVWPICMSV